MPKPQITLAPPPIQTETNNKLNVFYLLVFINFNGTRFKKKDTSLFEQIQDGWRNTRTYNACRYKYLHANNYTKFMQKVITNHDKSARCTNRNNKIH